jgi:Fe-S cluster assembly protein SufD
MSIELYEKTFYELQPELDRMGPKWVHKLRMAGLEMFKAHGFPTLRDEHWRNTRVRPIAGTTFSPVTEARSDSLTVERIVERTFDDSDCRRLVFVDGHYAPELSRIGDLPEGILLGSLSEALDQHPEFLEPYLGKQANIERHTFSALNTAFIRDGALVFMQGNINVGDPIHIVFASTGDGEATVSHPRTLVVAGANSRVTVVESFLGTHDTSGVYLTNHVSEFFCGDNAEINHCKIQRDSTRAYHVSAQQATVDRNGRFNSENISLGAALARNDVEATLDGEGIDCRLDGLYLATRRQHVDNHTFIRHAKPHCHSFESYKGILDGKSRGVFNGRIFVNREAQKTDAKQSNDCLLLSDDARINSNPQLEIFADDVRCTHGATVGQLDEAAVFYLRSRGIPDELARHMLIYAFAAEVFGRITVGQVRERLEADLYDWLSTAPNI